ncbi:MAG: hypothetical protein U9N76_00140 [Candidatus Marinimicrobia bacterium]|nr:hypothetical protein [Candidatus Neomarinimicrobiota bacterium]
MNKINKIYYWSPRTLCILAILFISLFALDSFSPNLTIWQQLGAFLIHLIPSFVLTLLLLIAWKWELVGGIIFSIIGIGFTPIIFIKNYNMNHSIWISIGIIGTITIPFIVVGILFILNHFQKKVNK